VGLVLVRSSDLFLGNCDRQRNARVLASLHRKS
jgi:hypothetical protein